MRAARFLPALLALAGAAGCSSSVVPSGAGGATGTTSGTTTSASSGAATTSASSGATTTSASSSSGAGCNPGCTQFDVTCCDGGCVSRYNDVNNCGTCGVVCPGPNPFCDNGTCSALPACMLEPGMECNAVGSFCCGTFCCSAGQLCCNIDSNVATTNPQCADPVNGTCPIGCPGCP